MEVCQNHFFLLKQEVPKKNSGEGGPYFFFSHNLFWMVHELLEVKKPLLKVKNDYSFF